ncbi:histidine kinase dimerization/phosphoacceptor domain -containing protein [Phenylobacterium sp.]|uniref:sensor histidine kinase n=1 Tax=Phenylobacterium sp. TaxID=1871053 RepID=UPI00286CD837|nr:histidine kinase dimerization/phosphoacceptor domain -containing protein [Phenylobacterium sp.]
MAAQIPIASAEAALSLTLAVVASSPGPLLLLDGELNIVAVSGSFAEAFNIDAAGAPGKPLSDLGGGEWAVPQLRALLEATISGAATIDAYEMDLTRQGRLTRCLVIHAERLTYLDLENPRLLVAVTDVTASRADAKARDEALRQNLVLLQEVRHRVANSLQIIASVLLQNAKKTQSDETRGHLRDAHQRVMSVAALERQLAGSGEPNVELHAYFTALCESIAASMIGDHDQLSLVVTGSLGVVEARVCTSMGLIVTELVINALKHAFPNGRVGKIVVDCVVQGPNWTLSISDDGVGMPADPSQIRVGLGTSIVQALARQLEASVETSSCHPGTRVAITHTRIALVEGDADRVEAATGVARPAA